MKKLLLIVLVLSIAISCTAVFASCTNEKGGDSDTPLADSQNPSQDENDLDVLDYLPNKKFNSKFKKEKTR